MFGMTIQPIAGTSEWVARTDSPIIAKVLKRWSPDFNTLLSGFKMFGLEIGGGGMIYQWQCGRGRIRRFRLIGFGHQFGKESYPGDKGYYPTNQPLHGWCIAATGPIYFN